jgi:hypothetical protein
MAHSSYFEGFAAAFFHLSPFLCHYTISHPHPGRVTPQQQYAGSERAKIAETE